MSLIQGTFEVLRGFFLSPLLGQSPGRKTRKNRPQDSLHCRGIEPLEDRSLLSITLLSEGFEGNFPLDNGWSVGDADGGGAIAYWDDVYSTFGGEGTNSGTWKGYCAGVGHAGTSDNPTHQNSMAAYMSKSIDLAGMVGASLSFWDKMPSIEPGWDFGRVYLDSTLLYQRDTAQTSWTQHTFDLSSYLGGTHTLTFEFDSDLSNTNEGWYLDDILVTGEPITYDLYGYDCYAPSALHWGESFDVQGRVGNMGNADVTADFVQRYYLSNDLVWGDADDIYLGDYFHTDTVPATVMGPLYTKSLTLPNSLPAGYLATGTFYIGMYTDANNNVAESVESNNQPGDFGQTYDWASFTISSTLWTVLVYYNGDNSLSVAGYNEIRNEMETVPYGSGLTVGILYDGNGDQGTPTHTLRGLIRHDTNTATIGSPLVDVGELDMGNPNTLEDFIEWGTATYPAAHYALVLGDHGGGYTGFGDGSEVLSMSEIRTALSNAGVHFDLLGYDACLMGMAEVAYDVRQWCDVFVASEAETPLGGWTFDTVLAALNSNPSMTAVDLGRSIVSNFGAAISGWPTTISSILTSQLNSLATALDAFADTSLSTATASDWTALRAARNAAQAYDPPTWGQHFRDLREFVVSVSTGGANAAIRAAAVNVRDRLDAAVDANWHEMSIRGNGLSIELPALNTEIHPSYNSTNLSFVANTSWKDFLFGLTGACDLTGFDCYIPYNMTWGQTFDVQGQVRNLGTGTVTAPFWVDFFLSKDQIWGNADDVLLGWYDHQSDVPGSIAGASGFGPDFHLSLTLPASPPGSYSLSGTFYIGMKTDSQSEIHESDETNNGPGDYGEGWDWDTFVVTPPDLIGLDCYVPAEITWGQTFDVQGQVRNYGPTTVSPPFWVDFFLSNDQIWGNADDVLLGWYDHQADVPANGDGPDFNLSLTLPAAPPAGYSLSGTFYLGMKTEALNDIIESDETNNGPGHFAQGWDWDSFLLPPPDLTGHDCYVPDEIAWGQAFSLQGQVRNLGPTTVTPSFTQSFYLSNDQVWGDRDDILLGTFVHSADVAAGDFGPDFNVSLTLPASAPSEYTGAGPFYIGMMTDALDEIAESNEADNGPGYWWQTYDWDSFTIFTVPLTRVWDGGSTENGLWTTKENWGSDMAPTAGDDLLFPAGAARPTSVNNFPAGMVFGSIIVSGGNYHFQNYPIQSTTVAVQGDAALTAVAIVCDTLTIGSAPGAAGTSKQVEVEETAPTNDISKRVVVEAFSTLPGVLTPHSLNAVARERPLTISGESISAASITRQRLRPPEIAKTDLNTQGEASGALSPYHVLRASDAFRPRIIDAYFVNRRSENAIVEPHALLRNAAQAEPTRGERVEKRPWQANNSGESNFLAALQAVIRDFHERQVADPLEFDSWLESPFDKPDWQFEKAVDAVLARE